MSLDPICATCKHLKPGGDCAMQNCHGRIDYEPAQPIQAAPSVSKEAEKLADAYAEASFDQGLHRRTQDPAPEAAREKLVALLRRQAEQTKVLRDALARLLSSDPEGAIATASEDDLTEAANDASADPVVREQAASVLQARSALAATKEET